MRHVLLLSLLILAACDTVETFPPEAGVALEGVTLTADRSMYDNDDEVGLTLRNDGAARVETGVLGCAALERRTDAGWVRDAALNDRPCILLLVVLEPGDLEGGSVDLDAVGGAPDGTYRFVHGTSVGDVASASFEVR